uniref:Uncharacterized protein n=1 Tax=Physcomitrium patens TaxID=3218 RepID=A0A2K1JPX6_PHYPA|nr:hypothetical protein PHYPA_015847 [Physcomitrium patens]
MLQHQRGPELEEGKGRQQSSTQNNLHVVPITDPYLNWQIAATVSNLLTSPCFRRSRIPFYLHGI